MRYREQDHPRAKAGRWAEKPRPAAAPVEITERDYTAILDYHIKLETENHLQQLLTQPQTGDLQHLADRVFQQCLTLEPDDYPAVRAHVSRCVNEAWLDDPDRVSNLSDQMIWQAWLEHADPSFTPEGHRSQYDWMAQRLDQAGRTALAAKARQHDPPAGPTRCDTTVCRTTCFLCDDPHL